MNVMLSYQHDDKKWMTMLAKHLRGKNVEPWIDSVGIEEGEPWRKELLRELKTCDAFVPVLSKKYLASEHCRMEVFIARSFGRRICPFVVENCFDTLRKYEETRGLDEIFMMRLYRLRAVGLPITKRNALDRIVDGLGPAAEAFSPRSAYVSYVPDDATFATNLAVSLKSKGVPTWVATLDCRVGDNWRDAQARAMMKAASHLVVIDDRITRQDVLRTEILLAEAHGLPTFTVLSPRLSGQQKKIGAMMRSLYTSDLTYQRLANQQYFDSTQGFDRMVDKLVQKLAGVAGTETV